MTRGLEILNLIFDMQSMDCYYEGYKWDYKNHYTVYVPEEACNEIDEFLFHWYRLSEVYHPKIRYLNGPRGVVKIVRL